MTAEPEVRKRSIPSLDGLRALAVGAVILSHSNPWFDPQRAGYVRDVMLSLGQGGLGVNAFFIISGFLITTLLIEERERSGRIDLRRFYFRRTLRIFPPYYVYLAVAALVSWGAMRPIPAAALLSSATYTSNYYPYVWLQPFLPSWYTLHTWSLAVEEQFYLIWPFLLTRLSRRHAVWVCVATVILSPFARVFTVYQLPVYGMAEQWFRLFHTQADGLALGCLLAFIFQNQAWRGVLERCLHPAVLLACVAFLLACAHLFTHEPLWLSSLILWTAMDLCLAYLIAFVVLRPATLVGRFLNFAPVRHIGLISYSLYLWQQLFLGVYPPFRAVGWNVLCVFIAAELSFFLVEQPSLRLRGRLEKNSRQTVPAIRSVS